MVRAAGHLPRVCLSPPLRGRRQLDTSVLQVPVTSTCPGSLSSRAPSLASVPPLKAGGNWLPTILPWACLLVRAHWGSGVNVHKAYAACFTSPLPSPQTQEEHLLASDKELGGFPTRCSVSESERPPALRVLPSNSKCPSCPCRWGLALIVLRPQATAGPAPEHLASGSLWGPFSWGQATVPRPQCYPLHTLAPLLPLVGHVTPARLVPSYMEGPYWNLCGACA